VVRDGLKNAVFDTYTFLIITCIRVRLSLLLRRRRLRINKKRPPSETQVQNVRQCDVRIASKVTVTEGLLIAS